MPVTPSVLASSSSRCTMWAAWSPTSSGSRASTIRALTLCWRRSSLASPSRLLAREVAMKVKAVININVGGPLVIDDLDICDPGPTHVIVKQFATGVCHSQLHQIHNPALPRPLVLGHESTG